MNTDSITKLGIKIMIPINKPTSAYLLNNLNIKRLTTLFNESINVV